MSAIETAMGVYQREPCARPFETDLAAHLLRSYVFATPEMFVMGRPVISTAAPELIVDPVHSFPTKLCDCWHVYLAGIDGAAGFRDLFRFLPYALPLISFERRNRLRFHSWERMKERLDIREPQGTLARV